MNDAKFLQIAKMYIFCVYFLIIVNSRLIEDESHVSRNRFQFHSSRLRHGDLTYRERLRKRVERAVAESGNGWGDVGKHGDKLAEQEKEARKKR